MHIYDEQTIDLFLGGQVMVLGLGGIWVEGVGLGDRHCDAVDLDLVKEVRGLKFKMGIEYRINVM